MIVRPPLMSLVCQATAPPKPSTGAELRVNVLRMIDITVPSTGPFPLSIAPPKPSLLGGRVVVVEGTRHDLQHPRVHDRPAGGETVSSGEVVLEYDVLEREVARVDDPAAEDLAPAGDRELGDGHRIGSRGDVEDAAVMPGVDHRLRRARASDRQRVVDHDLAAPKHVGVSRDDDGVARARVGDGPPQEPGPWSCPLWTWMVPADAVPASASDAAAASATSASRRWARIPLIPSANLTRRSELARFPGNDGWKDENPRKPRGSRSAPDRIRTCDLRFRRPTLYPAELRARAGGLPRTAIVGGEPR